MQLEFDLWEPVIEPIVDLRCEYCGEESVNAFTKNMNHGFIRGMCSKAFLLRNHCVAIVKHFEGDERFQSASRNCYAEGCAKHYRGEWSRNPIPECAVLEYDEKRAWLLSAGVPEKDIPVLPSAARIEGEKQ